MSQEGLNLNPVIRNGDAISNTSNPSREHNSTNVQFAPSVRKNLETPSTNNQSSQARPNITASQNGAPGSHHRRNLSATISEDGNGGRRKYFPKLLQPPKQRHTGMFPSPSPSINSVVSASNNGRNHKNGHGKTVTTTNHWEFIKLMQWQFLTFHSFVSGNSGDYKWTSKKYWRTISPTT